MTFFDQVIADNAAFFSDYAEDAVLTPSGGSAKPVRVVVSRMGETRISETQSETCDFEELMVSTVDLPAVTRGGDTFQVAARIGGPTVTVTVRGIASQSVGMWKLRVA